MQQFEIQSPVTIQDLQIEIKQIKTLIEELKTFTQNLEFEIQNIEGSPPFDNLRMFI